jgi:predicted unusual protein kinase regulating ubiquinone biosynthesis (AarF/ABC1/UbiB family)
MGREAAGRSARRWPRVAAAAGGLTAVAGAGAGVVLRGERRGRLVRTARVWRLTARRGLHWAVVRIRGARASEEERARLEEQFAIRSAEDVARELGNMKGAIMKAGQMVSFIADGLPPEAQAALATLQADVPPMAPSLAAGVVREELGGEPDDVFLDWDPVPVAAASIGQVHRAVLRDGRIVAVKVQYPGVDRAIRSDLDNAELLYGLFSALALRNLDVHALVDELRVRMAEELDYRLEAASQTEMGELFAGHPFIHVPAVVPELSTRRVLTSEWVGGTRWDGFLAAAPEGPRQKAAEAIFRFAQRGLHLHGIVHGDPHPGNYRFGPDGSVTFLDFGLVKRWSAEEWGTLAPVLDHLLDEDRAGTVEAMERAGFLAPAHGLDPSLVWDYVSGPYQPYLVDEFEFSREWTSTVLARLLDVNGPYADVMRKLNLPPSFVILDRVVWGSSAILGRMGARNRWRAILAEYREGAPPATELGRLEAAWSEGRGAEPVRPRAVT